VAPLLERLIQGGIICGPAGPHVLRFLPPLIVTREQVDHVVGVLSSCLEALEW
jgi:acetylornithine/N-succinyldiaminopimelate aminotransferase